VGVSSTATITQLKRRGPAEYRQGEGLAHIKGERRVGGYDDQMACKEGDAAQLRVETGFRDCCASSAMPAWNMPVDLSTAPRTRTSRLCAREPARDGPQKTQGNLYVSAAPDAPAESCA